jgi:arsenate reductase
MINSLSKVNLFSEIEETLKQLNSASLSQERKETLQPLIDFIQSKVSSKQDIRLNFICTHNSRRSHLTQIWAQTMAQYFTIRNTFCYSGGTEATALFPKIAETLIDAGFAIQTIAAGTNPIYSIKNSDNNHPIIGFSKKYDDEFNPKSAFAAIMTCSQADGGCPFIAGAEKRISISYEDPKISDNTPQQTKTYKDRSLQIATEFLYVFAQIKLS